MCGRPTGSSCSVPVLSPVGTHSYQQSHCCPPHTNQAVPYLSSAQSVPTVTNSHTAALHTQIKPFRIFPQPSRYPQLPTVTLLPSTHTKLSLNAQLHTANSPLPKVPICLQPISTRRTSGKQAGNVQNSKSSRFHAHNKCSVFPCNFVLQGSNLLRCNTRQECSLQQCTAPTHNI